MHNPNVLSRHAIFRMLVRHAIFRWKQNTSLSSEGKLNYGHKLLSIELAGKLPSNLLNQIIKRLRKNENRIWLAGAIILDSHAKPREKNEFQLCHLKILDEISGSRLRRAERDEEERCDYKLEIWKTLSGS